MKNKLLLITFSLFTFFCCKDNGTTKNTFNSVTSKNNASSIIAYYNAFVDYDAKGSKKLNSLFKSDFQKFSKMVENKKKHSTVLTWVTFIGIDPSITSWSGAKNVNLLRADDYLDDDMAKKTLPIVKNMQDAYQKTKKAYLDFKGYYENEDYKDDAWAKGADFIKTMEDNTTVFFTNRNEFYNFFEPTIAKAEEDILADHPIKDEIIHAKRTLKIADQISFLISDVKTPIASIEETYTQLENRYKEGINLDLDALKKQKKDTKFTNFYKEIDVFLGVVRKGKRDGEISDKDAKIIQANYTNVINTYNWFVK